MAQEVGPYRALQTRGGPSDRSFRTYGRVVAGAFFFRSNARGTPPYRVATIDVSPGIRICTLYTPGRESSDFLTCSSLQPSRSTSPCSNSKEHMARAPRVLLFLLSCGHVAGAHGAAIIFPACSEPDAAQCGLLPAKPSSCGKLKNASQAFCGR